MNNIKVREQDDLDSSSGSEIGGDRDDDKRDSDEEEEAKQRLKTKMNEDWNYLKKTLHGESSGFKQAQQ